MQGDEFHGAEEAGIQVSDLGVLVPDAALKVLDLDSSHAAAHINLGTLYYNRQDFNLAEKHYRKALEADPRYALAHFDLGNVLDETGRVQEAIQTYKTALQLAPTYADAHYNLAFVCEKLSGFAEARDHWQAYIRLEPLGPWCSYARQRLALQSAKSASGV